MWSFVEASAAGRPSVNSGLRSFATGREGGFKYFPLQGPIISVTTFPVAINECVHYN